MRARWTLLACLVALVAHTLTAAEGPTLRSARDLLKRVLPAHHKHFRLEQIPADAGRDTFEIESQDDKIVLRGNNGVALAAALNWYLKYECRCHYSLKARQMNLPDPLPAVSPAIRRVAQDRYRYFLNYCCFGYSLPWYDWDQWEKLIDWMALNGINAPLSVTGQEAVWEAAGQKLGFSDAQLRDFIAAPPYLPFGWMGCLDGWGGPLPKSWTPRHAELQRKILARERALGMTPVLQGFTGHVPPATRALFPGSRLHSVRWAEWETLLLDPLDPLFARFAGVFLREQQRLFGTDHLYAADTFIEMTPPSGETNFLADTARAIYDGMAASDPAAVWVLQGWTFSFQSAFWTEPRIQAFLDAVPHSRMLVLDLFCDVNPVWNKTRGFCGKPWAWCALQNFGDCVFLGGALGRIGTDLPAARKDPLGAGLSGIGFVNEGLDYNPVVFDFLFEHAWRDEAVQLEPWLAEFCRRAYGAADPNAEAAWRLLNETVFTGQHQVPAAYTFVPSLSVAGAPPYDPKKLADAWRQLLAAAGNTGASDAYRFDLVAVSRQVLGSYSAQLHARVAEAWQARNRADFQRACDDFLQLIRETDELLASRPEYLLGRWLADARRWGKNRQERDRLEWNARRVITFWGEKPLIRDYSRREWSGMLTGFYLPRWERFFTALEAAWDDPASFDQGKFDRELQDWERAWASSREPYPVKPRGDSLALSLKLWEKHRAGLARSFEPDAPSLTSGKPASASSHLPGCPPSLANDGRRRSTDAYWATDITRDKEPWWQVDFVNPTKIGRVVVVGYFGDRRHYGFTLEVSGDGEHWETVADCRANTELSTRSGTTATFAPRETRFLRVRQTSNSANTGRHLVEVLAFEE